jgi:DNA-binding CsgD family transcriptional regulator
MQANVLLMRREREVYELLREHRRDKEIAKLLGITARTVKFHLSSIFAKLAVKNRTESWAAYGSGGTRENVENLGERDCCGGNLGRG